MQDANQLGLSFLRKQEHRSGVAAGKDVPSGPFKNICVSNLCQEIRNCLQRTK